MAGLLFTYSPQPHSMNKIEDYGLKAVTLVGEGKQLLMAAVFAFHAGEALVQGATFQVPAINLPYIGTEKSIQFFELFLIDLKKGFKMKKAVSLRHCPIFSV